MKPSDYLEERGAQWYVRGSRVSLESLVHAFHDGLSAEAIARECFPTLTLEQVYGAVTAYLANRAEVDAYLGADRNAADPAVHDERSRNPGFSEKMARARSGMFTDAAAP